MIARLRSYLNPQPAPQAVIAAALTESIRLQDSERLNRALSTALTDSQQRSDAARAEAIEFISELSEAQQMRGSGPWGMDSGEGPVSKQLKTVIHEAMRPWAGREAGGPAMASGAYGDIDLALQNVEWRREVNLSWLEFSRWGIQQIILISRLYWLKNPIIRRLINISSVYVFGRGVEVSSPDEDANDVLKDFFERNKKVLGQIALVELEKAKYTDGNLFFAFFSDKENSGQVDIRAIEALEIQDIVNDPEDSDTPWYYLREWSQRNFDPQTGTTSTAVMHAWYPALGYDPPSKPQTMREYPVNWDTPVYHRKCGAVGKWSFGCPIIYPALDWAKASKRYLEACASVKAALSQIAMTLTTKGGQQALAGAKQQLGTTVGPAGSLWDTNPPGTASLFASGPGTVLSAFQSRGAGGDPEEVRRFLLMCCMVVGVPETFLGDVSTGNLATATTLDRPTELVFLEKQEAWREDLVAIAQYVLSVSNKAPNGKFRAALNMRKVQPGDVWIHESSRKQRKDGRWEYIEAPKKGAVSGKQSIEVKCTFPAIREGDIPALIGAVVQAMTLANRGGQIVGIDEKEGVKKLYEYLGIEKGDEIAEAQYPDKEYDPDRTKEILPAPIQRVVPGPGGTPQIQPGQPQPQLAEPTPPMPAPKGKAAKATEAGVRRLASVVSRLKGL